MKEIKASIVTIGDEILIGQITDTNSQWIATELTKTGITVDSMSSISDDYQAIISSIKNDKSDLLIITGGLGPTKDDITKTTLAQFFEDTLVYDQAVLNNGRRGHG